MQLTVKTLKGEKFTIEVEESHTIAQVKDVIETQKSELPAEHMKLIHSGKVLKDSDTIADCQIQPNAFLVVMISKKKKTAVASSSSDAAVAPAVESVHQDEDKKKKNHSSPLKSPADATVTGTAMDTSVSEVQQQQTQERMQEVTAESNVQVAAQNDNNTNDNNNNGNQEDLPAEAISNLLAMGFPEAEVRACLRAADGNANVAVEFLMNGIPDHLQQGRSRSGVNASASARASSADDANAAAVSRGGPLEQLRNHPQIDQLRRLVQSNPAMLQAVLTQIGQQQPELLQEINNHQELFLQIMNEPVNVNESGRTTTASTNTTAGGGGNTAAASDVVGPGGLTAEMMQGLGNPAQLARMIDTMTAEQLQAMSAMMGLTPEQLRMTAQAISQMPEEELQNYMNMAMEGMGSDEFGSSNGGAGFGGVGGGRGRGGGAGGDGTQYLSLTEEEMEAVNRLTAMGFDRMEVVQAYMACDKNEEMAANLLMDGGFGFMDDGYNGMGRDDQGEDDDNDDDNGGGDDDDMYD